MMVILNAMVLLRLVYRNLGENEHFDFHYRTVWNKGERDVKFEGEHGNWRSDVLVQESACGEIGYVLCQSEN